MIKLYLKTNIIIYKIYNFCNIIIIYNTSKMLLSVKKVKVKGLNFNTFVNGGFIYRLLIYVIIKFSKYNKTHTLVTKGTNFTLHNKVL